MTNAATDPRRWPVGLIGMLALVVAAEGFVARNARKFTTFHASDWAHSGRSVSSATGCAVVGFGDSLVKHGVVPTVLEARLGAGRSAVNLAVPGGQAPANYFLLRRLLRSGSRPLAVLVDGEMLDDDPRTRVRYWPELATLAECAELAVEARDPGFFAALALARLLPSYKARSEIRLSVTTALAGTTPDEPQSLPVVMRNWNRNGGACVLPARDDPPGRDPRLAELETADYRPDRWSCHPLNAAFVARFLDLADAHGVPVVWLLPPYHPEVTARRERHGWYGSYLAYLRGLQARHPGLTVVDGRHAGYPPEVLADMTHLSRPGAIAYSDALGLVLRDRLAGRASGRWVDLPRYDPSAQALAVASAVEDIRQSGPALQRAIAEARRRRHEQRLARSAKPGADANATRR